MPKDELCMNYRVTAFWNGKVLEYDTDDPSCERYLSGPVTVGADQSFVMGVRRNEQEISQDQDAKGSDSGEASA